MNHRNFLSTGIIAVLILISACNNNDRVKIEPKETDMVPKWKEGNVTYEGDSVTMNGYVVYDENKKGARPGVLIVHEWWGLTDYPKMRARELAKLGYVAMAIDMFGNGDTAANPQEAMKLTGPFYQDPQKARRRFDAALAKLSSFKECNGSIGAIGYCFGGTQVLNMAKLGDDLKAVVSFHGGLEGVTPSKGATKAFILVCHGADDKFVPPQQVDKFRKQMDSTGTTFIFKEYAGATHAFTNPLSTENGKKFNLPISYNGAADTASWKDMAEFFDRNLE